jgi:hypothetical protein
MPHLAYLDESFDKSRYVVAALGVEHGAVAVVRRQLRSCAPRGATRRHFYTESPNVKQKMLDTFRSLPGTEVLVWTETRTGSTVRRRARAIEGLVALLLARGLDRVVFDHVHASQQREDRQTLARALRASPLGRAVTYSHEPAQSCEPMLWIPDAAAWCAHRTDRWHRELDGWANLYGA